MVYHHYHHREERSTDVSSETGDLWTWHMIKISLKFELKE